MIELIKGIYANDLYLKLKDYLIFSDIHLGYEESLNKKGIMLPRLQFEDLVGKLKKILGDNSSRKVILNGDIKHDFGKLFDTEWRYALKLIDLAKDPIIILGNHDKNLLQVLDKRYIKPVSSFKIDDILVMHGDKIPDKEQLKGIKTIIIGHEHPSIKIKSGPRTEKFKCFLKGRWQKFNLIVMPSFGSIEEGSDIREKRLSPFLKEDISFFECFIVADKVYPFGNLSGIPYL